MKSSEKKIAANRTNGKKGTGPDNTLSTRYNAKKHGLLAAGVTELDDPEEYRRIVHGLDVSYADELTKFFRRRMALIMVRIRRAERYDAEFITSILNPRVYKSEDPFKSVLSPPRLVDPGLPASIPYELFDGVMKYQRYEVALENMLFRNMNGLERLERMTQGEQLAAPAVVDITIHNDPAELDSRSGCVGQQVVEGQLSEQANEGDAGEEATDADPGPSDSFSGRSDEQVMDETFAQTTEEDTEAVGDLTVQVDPAPWNPLAESSEETQPEETGSELGSEEEPDAER